jgi:molecular chaperone GrpE
MSRKTKKNDAEELPEEVAPEAQEETTPESELEQVIREREEFKLNWQRAQADYQNLKRRTAAEIDGAMRRSQVGLIDSMLLVLDNLDMALTTTCTSDDAKSLMIGVQMTRDQLYAALEREDVKKIATDGAFDLEQHEAFESVTTDEHEPGTILEAVQTGWTHKGVVLRHAKVKVAAAPAAPLESEDESTDN